MMSVDFRGFSVCSATECDGARRSQAADFMFRVPAHWISPVGRSPYALEAQRHVMKWLADLGCSDGELKRAAMFDAAGYVGIPFPNLSRSMTLLLGKYLTLWLLWDDVQIECLENRWRIEAEDLFEGGQPQGMTRFDHGWWALCRELATRRSRRWIEDVCRAMAVWDGAAREEAIAIRNLQQRRLVPRFAKQLELRIATIGMYPTVYLLEDAYGFELPPEFHADPTVRRIKWLANEIVGLGNDVFSFGKDFKQGHLNLISNLVHTGMTVGHALKTIIQMHNQALLDYDRLASRMRGWGDAADSVIATWLQDIRYASLGFSLWEAQAPRYTAHKLVIDGLVVEPAFLIVPSNNEAFVEGE